MNQQAKTDQVDAQVLALFGDKLNPLVRPLASEAQQQQDDLVTRCRQWVDMLTAQRNRLALLRGKAQAHVEGHTEWLTEQIKQLDDAIETQIQACQAWRQTHKLVMTVVGFLGRVPTFGRCCLLVAAMVAVRYNPVLEAFYERL